MRNIIKMIINSQYFYIHRKYADVLMEDKYCKEDAERIVSEPSVFLLLTADYSNLGDHLIAVAQQKFVKIYFPEYECIEISMNHYLHSKKSVKKLIKKDDLLLISGGGFIGTLWKVSDTLVSDIIKSFRYNRIIIMPQTIYYDSTRSDHWYYKMTKKIYSSCQNLLVCVRDKASETILHNMIEEKKILLLPDITLWLYDEYFEKYGSSERKGIGLCLREDKEKAITDSFTNVLMKSIVKHNVEYDFFSTISEKTMIDSQSRLEVLNQLCRQLSKYQLVITDRLHGMILSFLTGTPCIAIDNKSRKISGVFKWIENCNYVKVIDPVEADADLELKDYLEIRPEFDKVDLIKIRRALDELVLKFRR